MKILSLQPFFGGSHRDFNDAWITHSDHHWTVLALPDRHWKWRMRHAPLVFAEQISNLQLRGQRWDAIVCTDMLDVAALKGLVQLGKTPVKVYFHENQFAYPNRRHSTSDLHFAFTNFTTMVAADEVWFNSEFNRTTTLEGAAGLLKRFPDFRPLNRLDQIRQKSSVQWPGVDVPTSLREYDSSNTRPIVISWAARWEHDKGPDQLEAFLHLLKNQKINFRINIIGQSYAQQPPAFSRIKTTFGEKIDAWGFQPIDKFWAILEATDVIFSTADHEFFGLSVVQGTARGALPLVPNRLAYPEVIRAIAPDDSARFLYQDLNDAVEKLKSLTTLPPQIKRAIVTDCRKRFAWETRSTAMDNALRRMGQRS